jgi:hypothetical protein
MYKNFILTEAEKAEILNRHKEHGYKKSLNEHVDDRAAVQVHKLVLNPQLVNRMHEIISRLSDEKIAELEMVLDRLGINANSTPQEVHNKVEAKAHSEKSMEMPEGLDMPQMSKDDKAKREMAKVFHGIGSANIAAWGGVPSALILGHLMKSMPAGFAVSWGVTSILMLAADALQKSMEKKEPIGEDDNVPPKIAASNDIA